MDEMEIVSQAVNDLIVLFGNKVTPEQYTQTYERVMKLYRDAYVDGRNYERRLPAEE